MPYSNDQWEYFKNWQNFSKEKDLEYSLQQFNFVLDRLKHSNPFSIIRFGEGESRIVISEQNLNRKELSYNPSIESDSIYRKELLDSAKVDLPNYFIGIQSYTYKPGEKDRPFNEFTEQRRKIYELGKFSYEKYTCSRIFCNFPEKCVTELLPEMNKHECYFVGNKSANTKIFNLKNKWSISPKDAWKHDRNLYTLLEEEVKNINNSVFIITGGFFANILISKLAKVNNNNYYINVGSVFDPLLYGSFTRGYQKNCTMYGKWK
jgi:hypothetical protein